MDMRGVDTDLGWINRKFEKVRRDIEGLRSERRASATSVETGSFQVTSEGQEVFRIGDMEFGDRGVVMRRQDGTLAFEIRKLSSAEGLPQSVAFYDGANTRVIEIDSLFNGLRSPYFEYPFQPYSATSLAMSCGPYGWERTTTSGTFETLFVYDGKRQNPYLDLKIAVKPSDATTAAEVRVVNLDTGLPLLNFSNVPWVGVLAAGSATFQIINPSAFDVVAGGIGASGGYMRLGLQARRTAGTGSLTVSLPQSIGG